MAVTATYNTYDAMFPSYFSSLFATPADGNRMYSDLNSVQVFLEAGGMALAPFLVNRLGPKKSLLLSGCVMATRIFLSGVVTDSLAISAVKLLHAVELPIMLIAIFKYINRHFEPRLSSSIYLVGFQLATQVGAAVISPLAGLGYDSIGYAHTYLVMSGFVAAFTALSVLTLRTDAKGLPGTCRPRTASLSPKRSRSDRATAPRTRYTAPYQPTLEGNPVIVVAGEALIDLVPLTPGDALAPMAPGARRRPLQHGRRARPARSRRRLLLARLHRRLR